MNSQTKQQQITSREKIRILELLNVQLDKLLKARKK